MVVQGNANPKFSPPPIEPTLVATWVAFGTSGQTIIPLGIP